jgi:GTPase Era involved in 16S rRNA processing
MNTFKNLASSAVGTASTIVYTVPASTEATVIGLTLCNLLASTIKVTVKVNLTHLIKNVSQESGSTLNVIDGYKLALAAGDTVSVSTNTGNSVDVLISILEIS